MLTLKINNDLVTVDETTAKTVDHKPGWVEVTVEDGQTLQGNTFTGCKLQIPKWFLKKAQPKN